MNETQIEHIVGELRTKHPEPTDDLDLSDLELTLGLVPEGGVWRIADLTPAVFVLVPGDALFTITLGPPPESELPGTATLSRRRVESEKLLAELEWGEYLRTAEGEVWRRTHWTFGFPGHGDDQLEEWQRVSGNVRLDPKPQEVDRDESFARALLSRTGRQVGDLGAAAFAEPSLPDAGPPAPSGPRRQQVTDIWGNPIDKRRRRRR